MYRVLFGFVRGSRGDVIEVPDDVAPDLLAVGLIAPVDEVLPDAATDTELSADLNTASADAATDGAGQTEGGADAAGSKRGRGKPSDAANS